MNEIKDILSDEEQVIILSYFAQMKHISPNKFWQKLQDIKHENKPLMNDQWRLSDGTVMSNKFGNSRK